MSRKRNPGSLTPTTARTSDDQRNRSEGHRNSGSRKNGGNRRTSTSTDGVNDEPHGIDVAVGPNPRSATDNSNYYDNDFDPLTTKVVKVYKKNRKLANPAPVDSEDSFEARIMSARNQDDAGSFSNVVGTDTAGSDATKAFTFSELSSSSLFSSSGQSNFEDGTETDFPMSPHGFKLDSGLAFIYMAIPPDGGYGWLVLLLSFIAQLIVDGIIFSIGILLPFIGKEFNVCSAQVVLVGSIQIGCYFMGGAFSSALINTYGFRPVAMVGVFSSALVMLVASFSVNLPMMIVFYSILGGPALSMIWVSSQLIIGYYFDRYRPIASGFSCSGAGAGIFIFSITNSLLVCRIGWRNTVRVQVVLILLIFFIALAYREVLPTPVGVVHPSRITDTSSNEFYGNFYVHYFINDADDSSKKSHPALDPYNPPPPHRKGRLRRCLLCCRKDKAKDSHVLKSEDERSERNYVVRADPIQREDLFYTGPAEYDTPHTKEQFDGKELELVGSDSHIQRAAYRLHNIQDYESPDDAVDLAETDSSHGTLTLAPNLVTAPPAPRRKKPRKPKKKHHWLHTRSKRALNRLFDVHLLGSFEFRVLLASAFLYPMGLNIPFVYSKARTTIPLSYAQWISPAIGATNFIVRILCGFAAYKLRDWTNYICGGGMFLGGTAVLVSAFYGNDLIWFQYAYGLIYGIAPAVFATLRALIYVRYLGLSKLTNAFGITALAMGLGVFIGTTLGGVLVSKTGNFTAAFAFAGTCIMLSGGLKLILPFWVKYRENNKKN